MLLMVGFEQQQMRPSKAQQLHLAKKRINQINEDREMSVSLKSRAELELLNAKKLVKELTTQIQELKAKARPTKTEDRPYIEVGREVEAVKRQLSKIRLDMARISEEKLQAEKEAEAARLRLGSHTSNIEQLQREIEEVNEEEVLVELAQIQAQKELAAIEAQRKEEAEKFSSLIEETRKKISVLREEIEEMKDLEDQLAITNSDIEVLKQLKLIKEMDTTVESSVKNTDLQSVTEDLEAARKELDSRKRGAFQLMTSMDAIRNKLRNILEEEDRIKELEKNKENSIKNLNSKLLRAKDKLEAVSSSEEKAKSMLSSLSLSLEKSKTEKEAAEKDRESTTEEATKIRAEIQKYESETDSTEERLQVAMQELEDVKSGEAKALKKLKTLVENAVKTRASNKKSTITISRFEYDYLTGSAIGAQEMAEKKVVAANAWADALMASERELKIKIALVERSIEQLRLKEEKEIHTLEKLLTAKESVEGELQNRRQGKKSLQSRKSVGDNNGYNSTPSRQAKFRRSSASPVMRRVTSSPSFTMKRRRKVMLKIAKYFAGKEIENEKGGVSLEENE